MKQLIKNILGYFGYEISKAHSRKNGFLFGDIKFETDLCSVGNTDEGRDAAEAAIKMIRERNLSGLKVLDIGCGVGIIGLTLFNRLSSESVVREIVFSDINIFNLNSIKRTLRTNNFEQHLGKNIRCYLSDGMQSIPGSEKFDLIISNPPHLFSKKDSQTWLTPGKIGTYDDDWIFHSSFYKICHNWLNENGEVWFFENASVDADNFLHYINSNPGLKFITRFPEPFNSRFYWMISKKN